MASPAQYAQLAVPAGSSNGISLSQTPAGAGLLLLNGALVTGGVANLASATCPQRRVLISDSGADPTVVFTVNGTNQFGLPISSTVTGLSTSSAFTPLDYATVTSVSSSAGTVGAITVGTGGTASTPWMALDLLVDAWAVSARVIVGSGCTVNVDTTYDDVNPLDNWGQPQNYPGSIPPEVVTASFGTAITSSANGNFADNPITAIRLTVTAGTALCILKVLQNTGYGRGV